MWVYLLVDEYPRILCRVTKKPIIFNHTLKIPNIFTTKITKGKIMANSNLLKEAIADAKAVRETAIANAKIALEEAFTPRLQSILSQKLTAEMEGEEEDTELEEENVVEATEEVNEEEAEEESTETVEESTEEVTEETVTEEEESEEGEEVSEGEESEEEEVSEGEYNADGEEEVVAEEAAEEEDEDELDLESIIRELEEELDDEEEEEVHGIANDVVDGHEDEMHEEEDEKSAEIAELKARLAELEGEEEMHEEESEEEMHDDEEIDLDEILREMGYGDDEEEEVNEEEESDELDVAKAELEEAITTIKVLKKTINEVNLLNAKLLYTNKLFRSYELTNEQKHKVVETLDRTGNVREVKLVFSTLAESFKFTGTTKKTKQTAKLTESFASKPVASTAPSKEVITESTNTMADRFKQLANIK
jgi:hypothetical protein